MRSCYQFRTMSVLDHGIDVWDHFEDLYNHLMLGTALKKAWRLPDWVHQLDLCSLPSYEILRTYLIYHDCGKPFCRTVDDEGRQHFPNHSQVSHDMWLEAHPESRQEARLMLLDMMAHTVCAEQTEAFLALPEAPALLLAALCEVHSNAQMFGGIESTSFKIKWKKLDKLGKKYIKRGDHGQTEETSLPLLQ